MSVFKVGSIIRSTRDLLYYKEIRMVSTADGGWISQIDKSQEGEIIKSEDIKKDSIFVITELIGMEAGKLLRLSRLPVLLDVGWHEECFFDLVERDWEV